MTAERTYFKLGFRETTTGGIIVLEAFTEPHHPEVTEQLRALLPRLVAQPESGAFIARCHLETNLVDCVGNVPVPQMREAVRLLALQGAEHMRGLLACATELYARSMVKAQKCLQEIPETARATLPHADTKTILLPPWPIIEHGGAHSLTVTGYTIEWKRDEGFVISLRTLPSTFPCATWTTELFAETVQKALQHTRTKQGPIAAA